MMYVAYYNPESKKVEVDTSKNYHEIKFYACQRGLSESDFKLLDSQYCYTKRMARAFEQSKKP